MAQKRSIFEDVTDQGTPPPGAVRATGAGGGGGLIDSRPKGARTGLRRWMIVLAVLVAALLLVNGVLRLAGEALAPTPTPVAEATETAGMAGTDTPVAETDTAGMSGMVNEPAVPPGADPAVSLDESNSASALDWAPTVLGAVFGAVWVLGLLWFLIRRAIPAGWTGRVVLVGLLGAAHGVLTGWLTGALVDLGAYRTVADLGLGFALLGLLAGGVLQMGRSEGALMTARRGRETRIAGVATGLMHFAFLQVLLGALVASIGAGSAFPTWPLMGDSFFPADAFYVPDGPAVRALVENPGLVQFLHRMAGYLLFILGLVAWLKGRKSAHGQTRFAFHMVLLMLVAQVGLGVADVLTAAQWHAALTHLAAAMVLWVLILRARHLAQFPVAGSIREGTA